MINKQKRIFTIPTVEVNVNNQKFFLPQETIHRPACQAFLNDRYYEPNTHEIINEIISKKPGNLIHAGTFFGDMLPSFSKACGKKNKLYAFEPILEHFFLSKKVLEANSLSNVYLLCAGLSDQLDLVNMQTSVNEVKLGGASRISTIGDEIVCTISIDQLNIKNLSCIQLDIEGHELSALKGGLNTIQKYKPIIMIEDNEKNCNHFLLSIDYIFVGQIPGLSIWKHKKDNLFT